ncbi:MAG: phosphonate ABC transporter, permease protein PhnE, partial [Candidatus Bipolaricaulota bacterium]|nr:phosphonate ABC transporter, permease protein PhnE [Candidatus Bipolaricaulota bacterium]
MGSFFVTRIASGTGVYIPIPGGFVVLLAIAAAAVWGSLGASVGCKLAEFLSGTPSKAPGGKVRARPVPLRDGGTSLGESEHTRALGWPGPRPTEASVPSRSPWYRTLWGWSIVAAIVVTLAAATVIARVDFSRLVQSFPDAAKILRRLLHPDPSILGEVVLLTLVTVFMGLMATLLAIPVAALLSFLAARNLARGPVGSLLYTVVRAAASIVRSIEPIIWAIVFVIWVRPGPFPGVLALFVCSIADLVKLYSEQLESIDPGPTEAVTAVGGRRVQVLLYSIVPQIINPYLSFTLYRWDINVRMGTVIGMVGGGGIGMLLMQYVRVNEW